MWPLHFEIEISHGWSTCLHQKHGLSYLLHLSLFFPRDLEGLPIPSTQQLPHGFFTNRSRTNWRTGQYQNHLYRSTCIKDWYQSNLQKWKVEMQFPRTEEKKSVAKHYRISDKKSFGGVFYTVFSIPTAT